MRLHVTVLSATLLLCNSLFAQTYTYTPPEKLNDGIRVGTLKDAGLDEAKIVAGTNEIAGGSYANIHSLLILKGDRLVYENYFTGEDVERGVGAIGVVKHTRDTLHDMRSVTKSVVGMALLHAHSKGKIKTLDQPVFDLFPEYAKYATGEKKNITIRHLLTMTSGLEWDEKISYADPKNSEIQMNTSANPIEYVFGQKLAANPGSIFNYSGGSSQLLAEIVKKATGLPVDEYTARHLFAPLGITAFKWVKLNAGQPSAASGLRLRSRDMAKLGVMFVVNKGKWNGKQIIPRKLAEDAVKPHANFPDDDKNLIVKYGYQIWRYTSLSDGVTTIEFQGNGGQTFIYNPDSGITMVTTAGHYNQRGLKKNAWTILSDFIEPSVIKAKAKAVK